MPVGVQPPAQTELAVLYCPTRRSSMEANGRYALCQRIDPTWGKGGNDYGGCIGSAIGWDINSNTATLANRGTYSLTATQIANEIQPLPNVQMGLARLAHPLEVGIFYVNSSVSIDDISDGTSNVIMVGEVDRLTATSSALTTSSDGWAWGGAATLFSTRGGINKGVFDIPASAHEQATHFALADGSARSINENINLLLFQNLGNIANGASVSEF